MTVVRDHPDGAGYSYRFRPQAYHDPVTDAWHSSGLQASTVAAMEQPDDLSFRLHIKPLQYNGLATLFTHYGGTQRLELTADGRLRYAIITDTGNYVVESVPLELNRWHRIAGRFRQGRLELHVDQVSYVQTAAVGTLHFSGGDRSLRIGQGYDGLMRGLKFYDWRYQPLLALGEEDGESQSLTVTLNSLGQGSITVRSLGHLNDQQTGSALSLLRVALNGGGERRFISVLSSEQYAELGGFYITHLADDAPPLLEEASIDPSIVYNRLLLGTLDFFVPPAYAISFGDIGSVFWEGINWIIPLEDFNLLFEQLYYFATDDTRYDSVTLALAAVGSRAIASNFS